MLAKSADMSKSETAERGEAYRHLRALAAKGAGGGISLLVASQQPYADVVLGPLRENLEARILLGHARADQSRMVLDSDDGERVAPDAPRGRALARFGNYVDCQVAWLDARNVDRWLPARRLHAVADSA